MELIEVECHSISCQHHDELGCVKGCIAIGKDGLCLDLHEVEDTEDEGPKGEGSEAKTLSR